MKRAEEKDVLYIPDISRGIVIEMCIASDNFQDELGDIHEGKVVDRKDSKNAIVLEIVEIIHILGMSDLKVVVVLMLRGVGINYDCLLFPLTLMSRQSGGIIDG